MTSTNIDKALWYASEKKCSVIPVRGDKRPFIKWEQYQKERATKKQIKGWFQKWPDAMIGLVTGSISDLSVIDIDTTEGFEEINKIIPDSLIMPTAQTPKGGQHLYFKSHEQLVPNNARAIPGCDFRGEGGYIIAPPSINADDIEYKWLDDLSIGEVDPPPLPDAYVRALASNIKNTNYRECPQVEGTMFTEGRRDNDLFHTAYMLLKSSMQRHETQQIIEKLIVSCYGKQDKKLANEKIESAIKRVNSKKKSFADEVREYIMSSNGIFLSSDVTNCLQLSSRQERKNLSNVLNRFCDEELIEKYGTKNGTWRIVDNVCEDIDFLSAPEESIDIKWPFAIEEHVKTLPKNIIVVAGEPNAGKTAFLLNVVKMNMHKHDINYFSSEMGAIEMRERLNKFNMPLEQWKFTPKERVSDFGDVIKPNSINIVDFLEVYEDFYRIGGMIKELFDKLDKGIAIIAIQKNKGNEYGLGGMRGLEKARLYLAMEQGRMKIVKAKNWATYENPNNLVIDFKLIQGCQFKAESLWRIIDNEDNSENNIVCKAL